MPRQNRRPEYRAEYQPRAGRVRSEKSCGGRQNPPSGYFGAVRQTRQAPHMSLARWQGRFYEQVNVLRRAGLRMKDDGVASHNEVFNAMGMEGGQKVFVM
jgi:hypothetical protein